MPEDIEATRQREEDQRNRDRLAKWWHRYCDANPMIWATGRRPIPADHPFRRAA